MAGSGVTPVTVLTGFLGSGKTTLLNAILGDSRFADTAVVVNEWGEVPVDHALVRSSSETVMTVAGGCVCCRVAGDLVGTLRELHFARAAEAVPPFRRVVIETTGLADPGPLLTTLIELPVVAARYSLAGVVTVVDAEFGAGTLDTRPEAVAQVAVADRLVVSKCDRAADPAVAAIEERLRQLNPGAPIVRAGRECPDPGPLLETGLHRGEGHLADAASWLNAGAYRRVGSAPATHGPVDAFVWHADQPRPWEDFEAALEDLLALRGGRILRMKGLVHATGEPGPRAVHGVHHTLYPSARLPRWPSEDRSTRLVFIGLGLEEREIAGILG